MPLSNEDHLALLCVKLQPSSQDLEHMNTLILYISDWERFTNTIIAHGSAPLFYKKLALLSNAKLIPAEAQTKLQQAYYKTLSRSMLLYQAFGEVAAALKKAGIELIALKGAYLSECLYGDIALRQFSDLDVLVREEDGPQCLDVLSRLGYQAHDPSVSEFIAEHTEIVHYAPMVKGGVSVEVHIRLHRKNPAYAIQTPVFIQRAIAVTIANKEVKALQLYDLLIHLCVHMDKHFAGGHIQMKCFNDIVNILDIHKNDINWGEFKEHCRLHACELLVFKYLVMIHHFYQVYLPTDILAQYSNLLTKPDKERFMLFLHGDEIKKYHVATHWQNMQYTQGWLNKIRYFMELVFPPKAFMIQKYNISEKRLVISDKFWWLWYGYRWWVGLRGLVKAVVSGK